MKLTDTIKFKPKYSPEIELILGDGFNFQWAGEDEDNRFIMYNNCAEVIEHNDELKICWNGYKMDPYYFLRCDHLDGHITMDSVKKTHNWRTGEKYYKL